MVKKLGSSYLYSLPSVTALKRLLLKLIVLPKVDPECRDPEEDGDSELTGASEEETGVSGEEGVGVGEEDSAFPPQPARSKGRDAKSKSLLCFIGFVFPFVGLLTR